MRGTPPPLPPRRSATTILGHKASGATSRTSSVNSGRGSVRRSNSMPSGAATVEQQRHRLFASIQDAQEGVAHTSYKKALQEINNGRKSSHWIWYVWPSLRVLRPGTSKPHFLLPDFATAQEYLTREPLASRIMEISSVALERLRSGVTLNALMGGLTDATKFQESLTVFAMAAASSQHPTAVEQLDLFCSCLEAVPRQKGRSSATLGGPDSRPAQSRAVALEKRALAAVLDDRTAPPQLRDAVDTESLRQLAAREIEAASTNHVEQAA